jgi:succinate dehydrogenase / fumarate reductase membrane anchor subunit
MATQVEGKPVPSSARVNAYGASSRPAAGAGGWETFSWYFFRVSGVALVFLAILHLFFLHVQTDVSQTSYQFIATRYANPFWRLYDLLLLTLALFHGLNGLRIACDDYIHGQGMRLAVVSVLFLTAIGFWLLGSMTIITFHAAASGTGSVSPLLTALAYL